jgi:hypothetical protein
MQGGGFPATEPCEADECTTTEPCPANGCTNTEPCQDCKIKLDAWHALDRYHKALQSKVDPLAFMFMRMLSDAMFMLDETDVANVKEWLVKCKMMSEDEISRLHRQYLTTRCRRRIPRPLELARRISAVVRFFQPMRMADDRPLFRDTQGQRLGMMDTHANMMRHILKGCLSDPPNTEMYYFMGTSSSGLPKFVGIRGSSGLEVRVHNAYESILEEYNINICKYLHALVFGFGLYN